MVHTIRGTIMKILPLLAALFLAASSMVLLSDTPASAYSLFGSNCRFDPANDDDGLGIGFSSTNFNQSRRDSTEYAAGRWNSGTTPQFTLVSYGSSTRDVRVEFAYLGAGGTVAQTTVWCGSGHYSADPLLEWNLDVTQPTSDKQIVTGEHELGHAYGLDHNNTYSCNGSTAGIMYAPSAAIVDACGWTWPTPDDFAGQVDAHNG